MHLCWRLAFEFTHCGVQDSNMNIDCIEEFGCNMKANVLKKIGSMFLLVSSMCMLASCSDDEALVLAESHF